MKYLSEGTRMIIGYADMVADLFHWGHVSFLRQCKSHCDYLIIGILQDLDIARFKKVPVMTTEERAKVVEVIKYVDEVQIIPFGYYRNEKMLEKLVKEKSITIWFHGDDRVDPVPQEYIESVGGKAIFIPYTYGISTSEVIERIKNMEEIKTKELKDRRNAILPKGKDTEITLTDGYPTEDAKAELRKEHE